MLRGVTAAATVMLNDFVAVCAVGVAESVALMVKVEEPEAVGVPEIVPVEAFNVRPARRDPELMDQVYGAVPPATARVAV